MDPTISALALAGAFNLVLASILLFRAPKTQATFSYAVLVGTLLLWIAAILVLLLVRSPDVAFAALATSYLSGTAIAASFWYFVAFFAERPIRPADHALILGGAALVSLLAFWSPAFIQGIVRTPAGTLRLDIGPAHAFFMGYLVAVLGWAFIRLTLRYRTAAPEIRAQTLSVLLGTLLTTVIGTTFNVFLVAAGNARYIGWGPVATIIMVAFIAYAIIRQHLMSIRLVGAELFTLLLVITSFIQLLFAPGWFLRLINGLTLALSVGFGTLLIRSVLREVHAREVLATANEELKRLDAAKSEFISIASHQLRTPLGAIRGYLSLVLQGDFGPVQDAARQALNRVLDAAVQLTRLVSDLLDLSRIEAGRLRYEFRPIRLEESVEAVVKELEETAARKGIRLEVRTHNHEGQVMADSGKMHEVVMNLVDNAIAYSPPGVITITLRSSFRAGGRWLTLSVTDRGIGIAPEDIARLFTKFGRTERAKRERPDGMGLGLYLVKRIVEDHRGRVSVESPGPGKGSTFSVELPLIEGKPVSPQSPPGAQTA